MPRKSDQPGYLGEKHYLAFVEEVRKLKREGNFEIAKALLIRLLSAVEEESIITGHVKPPWYYNELAKIYRKQGDYESELSVLERYGYEKDGFHIFSDRMKKAKRLLEKQREKMSTVSVVRKSAPTVEIAAAKISTDGKAVFRLRHRVKIT